MSESEAEAEEPTNHEARNRVLWLAYFSVCASDSSAWYSLDRITVCFRLGLWLQLVVIERQGELTRLVFCIDLEIMCKLKYLTDSIDNTINANIN